MIPKFLYHYTKVESLKLILKNQTIRFSRLDLLNDPTEGYQPEFPLARRNVFVSSWTLEQSDSLPMWSLYCGLKGARLKFPIDIFCFNRVPELDKNHRGEWSIVSRLNKPYEVVRKGGFIDSEENRRVFCQARVVYGPDRVVYVPEIAAMSTDVLLRDPRNAEKPAFCLGELGLRKSSCWSFENEFRFRVIFSGGTIVNTAPEIISQWIRLAPVSDAETHIDVEFNKNKVDSLELLLGPQTDDDDRKDLEMFLESMDYKYEIKRSDINVKISW